MAKPKKRLNPKKRTKAPRLREATKYIENNIYLTHFSNKSKYTKSKIRQKNWAGQSPAFNCL